MEVNTPQSLLEVAIVGAGPGGLVCAKTLLELGITNIAVFEETGSPGGVWNKEARVNVPCHLRGCGNGAQTVETSAQPMYENLKANFAKDVTSFLGYPFDASVEFFPEPEAVHEYYRGYTKVNGLETVIHYHSRVIRCRKVEYATKENVHEDRAPSAVWKIQVADPRSAATNSSQPTQEFTSKRLLVCNGHFKKAFSPELPGIENVFGKRLVHSSAFTCPKDLVDSRGDDNGHRPSILIVGAFASGSEICAMLARYGKYGRLIISVRTWTKKQDVLLKPVLDNKRKEYGKVIVRPEIERIDNEGKVYFKPVPKGRVQNYAKGLPDTEQPDIFLFATGYRYHFPFLEPDNAFVRLDGYKMTNLYKRVLYAKDHSLAFIGITNQNLSAAIVMEYQARWYAQVVVRENCARLKSEAAQEEIQREIKSRERDDGTQDSLMLKCPAYCNSLAADIRVRGYFTQLLLDRLPLHLRSLWFRRHPSIYWVLGVAGVAPAALAWLYYISYPTAS